MWLVESHIASWWTEKRGQGLRRHLTLSHLDLWDLSNRYLWVRLGEHHLWKWEGPEQLFRATDFFPHPGFNQNLNAQDHNDDIMLIRLSRKAFLGPAVQPLNLSRTCVSPGTQCLISGWGATSSPKGTAHARGLNPLSFSSLCSIYLSPIYLPIYFIRSKCCKL